MIGYFCPTHNIQLVVINPCLLKCPQCDFSMESDTPFEDAGNSDNNKVKL